MPSRGNSAASFHDVKSASRMLDKARRRDSCSLVGPRHGLSAVGFGTLSWNAETVVYMEGTESPDFHRPDFAPDVRDLTAFGFDAAQALEETDAAARSSACTCQL